VSGLRPEVPDGIAAVVRRLMAKSPGDRFQTPSELAKELERWLASRRGCSRSAAVNTPAALETQTWSSDGEEPPPAAAAQEQSPPPRPRRRLVPLPAAVFAALAAGFLLTWLVRSPFWSRAVSTDPPGAAATPTADPRPFVLESGRAFPDLASAVAAA